MVNHHSGKFGSHRQCGSGDTFLVVKEQYSICHIPSAMTNYLCLMQMA